MNRSTVAGFAVGPVGAALLAFVSLPLMTWIFPQEVIGQLSMLKVAIQFSVLLFCLGFDQSYVREYHESRDKASLLWHAVVPGSLLLVATLSVCLAIFPGLLSSLLYGQSSALLSVITILCIVVAFISRFLSLVLRMQDRGLAFSMSQVLAALLLLFLVLSFLWLPINRSFTWLGLAQLAALTATLMVLLWNTRKDWWPALRTKYDKTLTNKMLRFGWPLIFGGVASWGLYALDRVFLRAYSTYEELAIYSVAASIGSGVTIVSGVFNTIWSPIVFKWQADGQLNATVIEKIAQCVVVIVLSITSLACIFSWIVRGILPSNYIDVSYIFVGCMLPPMLYTLSEVTGIGVSLTRKTAYSLAASVGAVVVNCLLCFILIPAWGAKGAMMATVIAFSVFLVIRTESSCAIWKKQRKTLVYSLSILSAAIAMALPLFGLGMTLFVMIPLLLIVYLLLLYKFEVVAIFMSVARHGK